MVRRVIEGAWSERRHVRSWLAYFMRQTRPRRASQTGRACSPFGRNFKGEGAFYRGRRQRLQWLKALTVVLALAAHLGFSLSSAADAIQFTFHPNQSAANVWVHPAEKRNNGHFRGSFSNESLWPRLRGVLKANGGAFGVYASEIGYMRSRDLENLRRAGIRLSVETPAWTQCKDGAALARAELYGEPVEGKDIFAHVFQIRPTGDRTPPFGNGWFKSFDHSNIVPDEIVLDHRIEALIPMYLIERLVDDHLPWRIRKEVAKQDPCPIYGNMDERIDKLISDYVRYARLVRQRFGGQAKFSFHWNVNPGYEWRNEEWLDQLFAKHPDGKSFRRAYRSLEKPMHMGQTYLARLIDRLCREAYCPFAVYMDVNSTFNTDYAIDELLSIRKILRMRGVNFGIDLVDECDGRARCYMDEWQSGMTLRLNEDLVINDNIISQASIMHKIEFYLKKNIIDSRTFLRIQSWSKRPSELGLAVSEEEPGSFANTAMHIFTDYLIPRGWAHKPLD